MGQYDYMYLSDGFKWYNRPLAKDKQIIKSLNEGNKNPVNS